MRSLGSGRIIRRAAGVAAASFLATTLLVGVASHGTSEPAPPREVTINAALIALTSADALFLSIPTIPGDSLASQHPHEIVVTSMNWGVNNPAGTAAGAVINNLTVTKQIDSASPALMKATAAGTALGTIVITGEKSGTTPVTFVTLTLTGAKARSFNEAGGLAALPVDSVAFSYTSMKLTYIRQNSTGTSTTFTACWNLLSHVAC